MPSVKRLREDVDVDGSNIIGGHETARPRILEPLKYAGTLDSFKHQDLTPVIGREFEGLQVTDLLKWGDEMIRDLAITSPLSILIKIVRRLTDKPSFTTWCSFPPGSGRYASADERPNAEDYGTCRMRMFFLDDLHSQ